MQEHFDASHFVLGSKNPDVKFAHFYSDITGSRKIKCVTSGGLIVYLSLFDASNVQLSKFAVHYPVTELNVSVKLDFTKQSYSYSRSDTKPLNNTNTDTNIVSFIDIEENVFLDWVHKEAKLAIEIIVGKKRPIQEQQKETDTKKANTVKTGKIKQKDLKKAKQGIKKAKQGIDKNTMKSLRAAHKKRKRDEYRKGALKDSHKDGPKDGNKS